MTMSMILDLAVIALLIPVGGYAFILNRRLNALRAGQEEFHAALQKFDAATRDAAQTLNRIEDKGIARGAEIDASLRRSQLLLNELSVMTSAGEHVADRIETALRDVRAIGAAKIRKAA